MIIIYYVYVGLVFYRAEFQSVFYKLTRKQLSLQVAGKGDLQIPDYDIMEKAAPEDVEFVAPEELSFAPAGESDE